MVTFEYLRPATLLKKRLWHKCFPVNFVKFLRTPFFIGFFHYFEIFIFWVVRGVKGKSIVQNENNNYIRHAPYLWNSITDDQDFWYTCVKWSYLQWFFSFLIFSFFRLLAGEGVKRQKIAQHDKQILSVELHISGTYIICHTSYDLD